MQKLAHLGIFSGLAAYSVHTVTGTSTCGWLGFWRLTKFSASSTATKTPRDHKRQACLPSLGPWVSSLIYADDVILLSWASGGLQRLLNSMHEFCGRHGLTISASKTEVVVFNGSSADTWYLGEHAPPRSTSFKYLGLIFHESGSLSPALARLAQNGNGATALLHHKFKKLMCDRSFPMMRRPV